MAHFSKCSKCKAHFYVFIFYIISPLGPIYLCHASTSHKRAREPSSPWESPQETPCQVISGINLELVVFGLYKPLLPSTQSMLGHECLLPGILQLWFFEENWLLFVVLPIPTCCGCLLYLLKEILSCHGKTMKSWFVVPRLCSLSLHCDKIRSFLLYSLW